MTPDELVERVAREIYGKAKHPKWPAFDELRGAALEYELDNARYSIAVLTPLIRREALEEAAKVAEDYEGKGFELGLHTQSGDAYVTRSDIAAAIRALKSDGAEPTQSAESGSMPQQPPS